MRDYIKRVILGIFDLFWQTEAAEKGSYLHIRLNGDIIKCVLRIMTMYAGMRAFTNLYA